MKEMIVCLGRDVYADRFCRYVRKNYQQEFRIVDVVDKSAVVLKPGEILLTDEWELYQRFRNKDCCYFDFEDRGEGINPYQSVEHILNQLLWSGEETSEIKKEKRTSVFVFYTPGGSSLQRRAAMQKCRELGNDGKCLYICVRDLEPREEEGIFYDLSELCYGIRRSGSLRQGQILAAVEKGEQFDRLRGFHYPVHLGELGMEIGTLLEEIGQKTDYVNLVLDLQVLLQDYKKILKEATEIYAVEDTIAEDEGAYIRKGIRYLREDVGLEQTVYQLWKWGEEKKDGEIGER